jgi:hypothetical protein
MKKCLLMDLTGLLILAWLFWGWIRSGDWLSPWDTTYGLGLFGLLWRRWKRTTEGPAAFAFASVVFI